jgi:hypothetical protein
MVETLLAPLGVWAVVAVQDLQDQTHRITLQEELAELEHSLQFLAEQQLAMAS